MKKYRKYNWPELVQAFESSGLTQTAFCEQQDLNPKYFSQKRSELLGLKRPAFDKVDVNRLEPPTTDLTIQVGRCHIHCPKSMPIESFISLVHHLA